MKTYFNNVPVAFLENDDVDKDGKIKVQVGMNKNALVMIMSSYCGHCNESVPVFSELARKSKLSSYAILIDGNESERALGKRLDRFIPNIMGVPTFTIFKNGEYKDTYSGNRRFGDMMKWINDN